MQVIIIPFDRQRIFLLRLFENGWLLLDEVQNEPPSNPNYDFFVIEVLNKMPKVTITNEETGETKEYKLGYGANLRKSALFQDVDLY